MNCSLPYPYVMGTSAFNPYHSGLGGMPQANYMCSCSCHSPTWMGLGVPICWCKCNKLPQPLQIVSDNSMSIEITNLTLEIGSLRKHIAKLEDRLEPIERWKAVAKILCDQTKKPHKCPICEGEGGTIISGTIDENCRTCEGKGIVWG